MINIGNLPTGWAIESLNELCILNPRHDKTLSDNLDVSFIPMAAVDEKTGTISPDVECRKLGKVRRGYTHFADGDVIFAKITPCMENGKSAIAENLCNGLACGSTEFYTLRSNGAISPQYLHPFLRQNSYINNASMNMTGVVGQRRVPKDFILSTQIPLAPLNEQKRIVAKIEALQTRSSAVKEELEAIKPLLNQFRQSVLAAAFRGDLTKDWRSQNPDVEQGCIQLNSTNSLKCSSNLPSLWRWFCIEDIGQVKGGKRLPKGEKLVEQDTGHPYIRAGNLKNGTVTTDDLLYLKQKTQQLIKNYIVSAGDVYITIVGACIGDAGIIPDNLDEANLTENAAKICALVQECNNKFLSLWLRSPLCQSVIRDKILSAAQGKLALFRIRALPIPIPSVEEQKEIVRRIESLFKLADSIEQQYQQAEIDLETLNQSILAKAFRGELVPQDPNDEPASVLLERIKEERDRAKKFKTKTTKKKKSSNKQDKQLGIPGI